MTDELEFGVRYVSVNRDIYHDDTIEELDRILELARWKAGTLKGFIDPSEKALLQKLYDTICRAEDTLALFPKHSMPRLVK